MMSEFQERDGGTVVPLPIARHPPGSRPPHLDWIYCSIYDTINMLNGCHRRDVSNPLSEKEVFMT